MFQLDPHPTFQATVHVSEPGGQSRPLEVVFRHKTKTQLDEFQKDTAQTDLQMVGEIVDSVPDAPAGQTVQQFFTTLFENFPAAALDVYITYVRELTVSRVKN